MDGDTFKVTYDGEQTSVRIVGINAPERNTPEGPAATKALTDLVDGKMVRLEFTEPRKRDNFGRLHQSVLLPAFTATAGSEAPLGTFAFSGSECPIAKCEQERDYDQNFRHVSFDLVSAMSPLSKRHRC